MSKELTLEQVTAKLEKSEAANTALKASIAEKDQEISDLKDQISAKSNEIAKSKHEVPGTYKHKSGVYKFVKGHLKVSYKGIVHDSVEALTNSKLMDELISIGAGCLEKVVEPSK